MKIKIEVDICTDRDKEEITEFLELLKKIGKEKVTVEASSYVKSNPVKYKPYKDKV